MRIEISVSVPLTRRINVHEVRNDMGHVIYQETNFAKLLRWLEENDHHDCWLVEGDSRWELSLYPLPR